MILVEDAKILLVTITLPTSITVVFLAQEAIYLCQTNIYYHGEGVEATRPGCFQCQVNRH